MTNRKLIAREWDAYRRHVLPANAGDVQVDETRKGFYAGAHTLLVLILKHLSGSDDVEDADLDLMDDIKQELDEYAASVMSGSKGRSKT